jgi:hypothetical protein
MAIEVNYNRKMVPKQQTSLNFEYDTLETVLKEVKRLIKDYGKDAKIQCHCDAYSNSDKEYMYVYMDELETDGEMAKRIAQEEQWKKDCDERDASEYRRLQEKYNAKQ